MKLDFLIVAEVAKLSQDGTFHVIGAGFDSILARSFPAIRPSTALIGRIVTEPSDCCKSYDYEADIFAPDGKSVVTKVQGSFTPLEHPRYRDRNNCVTICVTFELVTFPSPGDYVFILSVRGKLEGRAIIEVFEEDVT